MSTPGTAAWFAHHEFRLAWREGTLARVPYMPRLDEKSPRGLYIAPADAEAHLLAGWSNYELGRWEKGVAHARVAAAAAPSHAPTWNHLAAGLRMLGRAAQA